MQVRDDLLHSRGIGMLEGIDADGGPGKLGGNQCVGNPIYATWQKTGTGFAGLCPGGWRWVEPGDDHSTDTPGEGWLTCGGE